MNSGLQDENSWDSQPQFKAIPSINSLSVLNIEGLNNLTKSQCQICSLWFQDEDLDAHLNQHLEGPAEEPGATRRVLKCPTCDKVMDAYYGVPFRVGGTGPGMRLLIGAWAELGEEPIPIDLFLCSKCGRIQPFANAKTRARLERAAEHDP